MGVLTKSKLRRAVEEKTAELEESRDLIRQITDTIPDVIYIFDINQFRVVYLSGAVKSFGYTPDMIYRMGEDVIRILIHPEDYDRILAIVDEMVTFKTNELRENQFRIKAAEGDWRSVFSRTVLFKNGENGKPLQILGMIQDVTAKINVENAYKEEKYRSRELTRVNTLLDLFVHAAAHDLKGPTGNLMVLTELINNAKTDEKRLELTKKLEPIVRSLNRTITSLLDIVKMENESESNIKYLGFREVFDIVISEFTDETDRIEPLINVNFRDCPGMYYIESFLFSVFRNMISNSLKYRSKDRRLILEISSERKGNEILLKFKDNGLGFRKECYENLFKPLTRFSTQTSGTGIGLYLINTMITRNGGRIELESQTGTGSEFRIFLIEYLST